MSETDPTELTVQIRQARGKFVAMASTYCLGVFNDNFFKQAAALVALYLAEQHAIPATRGEDLQNLGTAMFMLPWLLFAAPAGWMADRFCKRNIVIFSKALELAAMLCGGVGIIVLSWPLVMAMLFLMGLQACIFSPALNGSIPELYPAAYVIKANSFMKMLVTSGNLVGIIAAGVVLNFQQKIWGDVWLGRAIVGVGVVAVAMAGLGMSFGTVRRPAADPGARFPWAGPWRTLKDLRHIRRTDRLLTTNILADAFVWFIAVWQILIVNKIGAGMFHLTTLQTSFLLLPELLGVGVGGLLAGRVATGDRWYRVLPLAMLVLAAATGLVALTPALPEPGQIPWLVAMLALAGIAGGVMLVPMESFFQTRPAAAQKGAVIAVGNFTAFLGMILSAVANAVMVALALKAPPTARFLVVGGLTLLAAGWLWRALAREGAP